MDVKSLVAEYLDTVRYVIDNPDQKRTFLEESLGMETGGNPQDYDKASLVEDLLAIVISEDLFDYVEEVVNQDAKDRKFAESVSKLSLFSKRYELPGLALETPDLSEDDFYDHLHDDLGVLSDLAAKILAMDAPDFVATQDSALNSLLEYFANLRS